MTVATEQDITPQSIETDTEQPVEEPVQPRMRRGRLVIVTIALTLSLFVGLIAGSIWISNDDTTWQEVFTTPLPTITPTPEIAQSYSDDNTQGGYFIWELSDLAEWLVINNSNTNRSLREAAELLEDRVKWTQAEHPTLDDAELAAVTLIQERLQEVVFNILEDRDFEVCFFVHPNEKLARILELGLSLSADHTIQFPSNTHYIPDTVFERYMLLEQYERDCITPPPPEKR